MRAHRSSPATAVVAVFLSALVLGGCTDGPENGPSGPATARPTGSVTGTSAGTVVWDAAVDVLNTVEYDGATHRVVAVDTSIADGRVRLDSPDGPSLNPAMVVVTGPVTCTVVGSTEEVAYLTPGPVPEEGLVPIGTEVAMVVEMYSPVLGARTLATLADRDRDASGLNPRAVGVFPVGSLECPAHAQAHASGVWHLGMAVEEPTVQYAGQAHPVVAVDTTDESGARLLLDEPAPNGDLVDATALAATQAPTCLVFRPGDDVEPGPTPKRARVDPNTVATAVISMTAPTMDEVVLAHWQSAAVVAQGVLPGARLNCRN